MKWKITIRFMLAVLAVMIASNLVNVLISNYFSFEKNTVTQVFSGILTITSVFNSETVSPISGGQDRGRAGNAAIPQEADTEMFITVKSDIGDNQTTMQIDMSDAYEQIRIKRSFVDAVKTNDGWIQIINDKGEEIANINKPESIKTSYTKYELNKAVTEPLNIDKYVVIVEQPDTEKISYVVGMPKPDISFGSVIDYNLDYFRQLDSQNFITFGATLIIALILGYLMANRLNKPVVKITDGIAKIAAGDYNVNFPCDSFYKEVYKSLDDMAAALKSAEQERKKNEKIREEWITNISHDLKTPLSSIQGYGELLYESAEALPLEDLKKYISVIREKSEYMDALIEDLKLTQKLKNDLIPLKKEKGNLVEVLRETVISILNNPEYENRTIHFDSDNEQIMTEYDWLLFKRAFTNIISNAIIHNPEETEIWVSIRKAERVCVEITDNGNGISEIDKDKLFTRYYRGTSTNKSYAGTGLGLAIAREIIEAHGGSIELDSRMGEGTTIRVLL